ncbi:MAG: NTP transferase domain-containing protein [Myxococcales bacterium]|jgi:molybdopterin-guanine dinucleotide biosynthesis protein A
MSAALVGIFVGGQGLRMGGRDKSALPAPDGGTVLSRWLRVIAEAGIEDVVLVGGQGDGPRPRLADDPPGCGPLGGLCALLAHAGERPAIALACDMPAVDAALLARLAEASCDAAVLAPRDPATGKWDPLFARYDAPRVLPLARAAVARRELALQGLLRTAGAGELTLSDTERARLLDWDEPGDVQGGL